MFSANVSAARRTGARVYVTKTEEFHLEPVCYTSHLKVHNVTSSQGLIIDHSVREVISII